MRDYRLKKVIQIPLIAKLPKLCQRYPKILPRNKLGPCLCLHESRCYAYHLHDLLIYCTLVHWTLVRCPELCGNAWPQVPSVPDPSKVTETLSDFEIMKLVIFLQDCPQLSNYSRWHLSCSTTQWLMSAGAWMTEILVSLRGRQELGEKQWKE